MNKEKIIHPNEQLDQPIPSWIMFSMPFYVAGIFAVFLFPFAGDWRWLEGWILTIAMTANVSISNAIINRKNPRVLRNRMKLKKEGLSSKTKQSARSDRIIMPILSVGFFGALILPAFDHRFAWSTMPFAFSIVALLFSNAGLVLMYLAMIENAYASKILDINKGQRIIDTGLYGVVRHPLYSGACLMIAGVPIALGSWWGLLPAVVGIFSIVWRIRFEEDMLVKGMEGYPAYQKRVKYKLIPGIY